MLLSDVANCTVLRAIVLTQYRRVSDRRTDGNAIASTALAIRALRHAVKMHINIIVLLKKYVLNCHHKKTASLFSSPTKVTAKNIFLQ